MGWASALGCRGFASVLRVALVELHRIAARRDNVWPADRATRQLHLAEQLAWSMPSAASGRALVGGHREGHSLTVKGTMGRMRVAASLLLAFLVGSAQCFTRVATRPAGGGVTHLRARRACALAGAYRFAYGPSAYDECIGAKPARPLLPVHR
jgi:hypothetical protein